MDPRLVTEAARDQAILDAAREVDRVLVEVGALEGSSIHSALALARRRVLDLRLSTECMSANGATPTKGVPR